MHFGVPVVVMFKIRYWIKDFFGFPRSQVNGLIILLVIVTLLLFSEPVWHWWSGGRPLDLTADIAKLDSLTALWSNEENNPSQPKTADSARTAFYFNPNSCTLDEFIALGFSRNSAARLIRYREKGGKFRIKSDLLKIYGVDSAFYQRIYSFITLPDIAARVKQKEKRYPTKDLGATIESRQKFDLNRADTSALKKIYGIGEKLSLRIIKYRDMLGGFVTMDQLKEVYGLDSLVIYRLFENSEIKDEFQPKKININTATEKQLAMHPYMNKLAKPLVSYRFQHGNFTTLDEIRKVVNMNDETFRKIAPYLAVSDDM